MRIEQKLLNILGLAVVGMFSLTGYSQAPISDENSFNDIRRIDSLTVQLYTQIPSHTPPQFQTVESFNRQHFDECFKTLGSNIPFEYHEMVKGQVRYFLSLGDAYFDKIHQRMSLYFPVFEEILDKNALPTELKYVSVIESNLNPDAVSWCGATGLWQFMPYTGKLMGMKINVSLDERKSIIASTETACDYFKNSQMLFDDWLMTIASYNCGAGNVKRAIRRAGGGKKTFWQILPYLPKETQYYVPKFIAMTYVLNFTNRARNQSYNNNTQFLVPTRVDTSYHLVKMCNYIAGDESHRLLSLNREFIKPNTANATNNTILLPYDFSMNYVRSTDSLMEYALIRPDELKSYNYQKTSNNKAPVYNSKSRIHTVRKGETLSLIARRYGVSVAQLKSSNGLRSDKLRIGQRLIIRKGVTHKRNYN